ncbi:MAG TPA: hypothetical protein VFF40_13420 [Acidimicrobiia bacterium]|nr:hypothetical protein [Acidimicrobiia bacterium]
MNSADLAARVAEPLRARPRPAGRHLRVVDDAARRRTRRVRLALWAFGLVTAVSVFAVVTFHVALAQSEFELNHLSQRTAVVQEDYERARLAVAELSSPDRIVAGAEALGMVPAPDVRVVSVPAGVLVRPDETGGTNATGSDPSRPADDWGKVKPHLGAQR